MILQPITLKAAGEWVKKHHRHHKKPPRGWKFGVAAVIDGAIVGVAMAGRPVAGAFDDGLTLEVTRCCTLGEKNAITRLYGAIRRAAKALGYRRLITYTLESEPGTSLLAAGFTRVHKTRGGSWDRKGRPREDDAPTCPKILWEILL